MGVSDLVDFLVYELSSNIALKINSNALNAAAELGHFMICKTLVDEGADLTEVRTIFHFIVWVYFENYKN